MKTFRWYVGMLLVCLTAAASDAEHTLFEQRKKIQEYAAKDPNGLESAYPYRSDVRAALAPSHRDAERVLADTAAILANAEKGSDAEKIMKDVWVNIEKTGVLKNLSSYRLRSYSTGMFLNNWHNAQTEFVTDADLARNISDELLREVSYKAYVKVATMCTGCH